MNRRVLLLILTLCLCRVAVVASEPDDISDEAIRLNPELGSATMTVTPEHKYPFIRYDLNHIDMNGADWSNLADKLEQSRTDANFTIVHIGDSHIQADGNTGTARKLFQNEYGDAGRGIIVPFRLAGTNQPLDYSITSSSPMVKATLMRQPWPTKMGFTGVSLQPETQTFSLTLKVKSPCGFLTILSRGDLRVTDITSQGRKVSFETEHTPQGVDVSLDEDCTELTLHLAGNNVNIYGIDLRNDSHGVLYHAIGNNGAAYASYNGIADFAPSIASLSPDLVIISLGTNEAFGRFTTEVFTAQIDALVRKIRDTNPEAGILLVTPSECQRSVTVSRRTGKGKRRRTRKTRSYQVNTNVARARDAILAYGKAHNIPVYDFYAVAGGQGASAKWLTEHLLSTDRIHRTWAGYRLDGELTYDAVREALTDTATKGRTAHQ